MASVYRRGRIWWAKYRGRDGERKRISLRTARRTEAVDLLAELTKAERERRLGIGNGRTNHRPLAPIIEAFMREKEQVLRPSTLRNYRSSLAHVLPGLLGFSFEPVGRLGSRASLGKLLRALGTAPVSRITGPSASAWRTRRAERASARTASMEVADLKTILQWAEDLGEIRQNPLRGVKPLRSKNRRRPRALRRDDVASLIAASPRHLALAWRMFVSTGLRASELTGLNWGELDVRRRLAFIGETKTGVSRTVPLSGRLAEDLSAWREDRLGRGEPVGESDPVFVSSAGRRWCDTNGLRSCLRTCARADPESVEG